MENIAADCYAPSAELISATSALEQLQQHASCVSTQTLPLSQCHGRITAESIVSHRSIPGFDNSAMDGYAIAFADITQEQPTRLLIQHSVSKAGHASDEPLQKNSAIRILTGAKIPSGADTIIAQEDVTIENHYIVFSVSSIKGQHVRFAGEDVKKDSVIIEKGARLRPQDIALAAAVGLKELSVFSRLRVALFSTGDELHEPGTALPTDGIYDVNRYLLRACLEKLNCLITDYGILADNPETLTAALQQASLTHDMVITSGGASTGSEDHIANTLSAMGKLHFWRLAIKPGRPLIFGELNKALFVGLPGNPVAVMVCFLRFISPLIKKLSGGNWEQPIAYPLPANFSFKKKNNRREWLRAQLHTENAQLMVKPFHKTGTGIISSLTQSQGLIEIAEEVTEIKEGDFVLFTPYDHYFN
jgi:molybdopterin molybdotransferase